MKSAQDLIRDKARDLYQSDDISFDAEPDVSLAEDGAWVEAWVWVPIPNKRGE